MKYRMLIIALSSLWGCGSLFAGSSPVSVPMNVALAKPASANSVYQEFGPALAVDGDPSTVWTANDHGSSEDPNRLEVDLGAAHDIERVTLMFIRSGTHEGFTNTYRLYGSEDGAVWTPLGSGTLTDSSDIALRTATLLLPETVRRMRHLRYDVTGGTHWSGVAELVAHGIPRSIHHLAGEWTDGANPMSGSHWSIRAGDGILLLPIDDLTTTTVDRWDGPQPGFTVAGLTVLDDVIPLWFRSATPIVGHTVDWQLGDIVVHSGRADDPPTNVRWTSPGLGSVTLEGACWPVREIQRFNRWSLLRNHDELTSGVVGHGDEYDRANPFRLEQGSGGAAATTDVILKAGDAMRLLMEPEGGGIPDYAGVDLSITYSGAPHGNVYDFERDFTTAGNLEGNVWTYRSGPAGGGPYAPMPWFFDSGGEATGLPHRPSWHAVEDDEALPHVGCNVYPFALETNTGVHFPSGASFLHPGADGEAAVATFRCPHPGTLLIDCEFTDLDAAGGDGVTWAVELEDGTELASGVIGDGGGTGLMKLAPIFADEGALVHFVVDAGAGEDHDATRLTARITVAPAGVPQTMLDFDGPLLGGTLLDSSGREWVAAGGFALGDEPAKWGSAGSFDGAGASVAPVDDTSDFIPGAAPFTVEFWMHPLSDGGQAAYLVGKSRPDFGNGWDLRLQYGEILVTGVNGWAFNIGTDGVDDLRYIELNRWHHIALSCTESVAYLFVDGMLRGQSVRGAVPDGVNPFRIGGQENFGGRSFHGFIDEFRYWRESVWTEEFVPPDGPGMSHAMLLATVPPLTVAPAPDAITLRWPARMGIEYAVEGSLEMASWETVRAFAPASGLVESFALPIGPASPRRQFLRVVLRFPQSPG